ncbi:MAG: hypothetical protein NC935_05700 [Candidatus Omnitrophica bacterium]|nr:hypothetical protein [Candidatus Omnitrophota bacterium]
MIKKYLFSIILFLFFLLISSISVYATRGCCSWHGGVCGCDTSVGRQICCDGTYSPSCTCAYIPQNYNPPPKPQFPPEIKARWYFYANEDGTWNIEMEVLDNNPTKYSAVISKCAGCDPGPLVDFFSNKFYFNNIKPGKWYVNVKKEINEYWSNVVYWTIDVPEWQKPTPTYNLTNTNYDLGDFNKTGYDYENEYISKLIMGILGAVIGGGFMYFFTKKL